MWRTTFAVIAVSVAVWFLIDWLYKSDREMVEEKLERLFDAAREGGDAAVDEILAAFADDYRAEGAFDLKRIKSYLRRFVGESRVETLTPGGYKTLWAGTEILVPLLRLRVDTSEGTTNVLVEVAFIEQDEDDWRIVSVRRARLVR